MTNTLLTTLSAERLRLHYAEGTWRDDTIYSLARSHAERAPDKVAIRESHRAISFGKLIEAADHFAADLAARGVRPGQRVMVWLPSRIETAVALLACSRNSYVCCPSLHRDHTVRAIGSLMERTRAVILIGEKGYGADADKRDVFEVARALPHIRHAYCLDPLDEKPAEPFQGVLYAGVKSLAPDKDPNHVAYLAFTSGTTGVPKGVLHSDNTLLSNARAMAADWKITPETVIYTLSPLSHNLGFGALIITLATGAELVLHDLPKKASLMDRLSAVKANLLFGVPAHAMDLLAELRTREKVDVGAIRGFRISGAAVPGEVVAELLGYGIKPQSGYGMTETCSHQYTRPDDDPELVIETSGRAAPGYEIRIWKEEDREIEMPLGEIGEIGGRGSSLMLGYFDDQDATEDSFNSKGSFMTGDLGRLDAQGYLRITGRKKDVINRGGHKIFPVRIEALVMQHPAIDRVAIFPVDDQRLGEKVCVAVVLRPEITLEPEALLAHLADAGLSRYDMPEFYLQLETLPLTNSGKILKRELIDRVRQGKLRPTAVRWPAKK